MFPSAKAEISPGVKFHAPPCSLETLKFFSKLYYWRNSLLRHKNRKQKFQVRYTSTRRRSVVLSLFMELPIRFVAN